MKLGSTAETHAIRDDLLALAGRRPKPAHELFELLCKQWGTIGTRRLWRLLGSLVKTGQLCRVGPPRHCEGYVRVSAPQGRSA